MSEILIRFAISAGATIASAVIALVFSAIKNKIKNIKNERLQKIALEIAEVVENIYRDCTSEEKLRAFKDLCASRNINADSATEFLETFIIPTSKRINVLPPKIDDTGTIDKDGLI